MYSFSRPSRGSDYGRLPERPKGADCKSAGTAYVGSNPTPATEKARLTRASVDPAGAFVILGAVCGGVGLRGDVAPGREPTARSPAVGSKIGGEHAADQPISHRRPTLCNLVSRTPQ